MLNMSSVMKYDRQTKKTSNFIAGGQWIVYSDPANTNAKQLFVLCACSATNNQILLVANDGGLTAGTFYGMTISMTPGGNFVLASSSELGWWTGTVAWELSNASGSYVLYRNGVALATPPNYQPLGNMFGDNQGVVLW